MMQSYFCTPIMFMLLQWLAPSHLLFIQQPDCLLKGGWTYGVFIVADKVVQSATEDECHLGFNLDVVQWAAVGQQSMRVMCYYPPLHRQLQKTPMPTVGKHVFVQGSLQSMNGDRCSLTIQDIVFGPAQLTGPTMQSPPSSKLRHFDWYSEGKSK